ncbi:hypothetical protein KO500_13810 [Cellulophaga baltica]|uniref:DUF6503 family protein n=1 Tax=Cellulophaga TaxID=104264 RepID=UPI001C06E997|nr:MULTISPECIES: DUF6503 family protein [Cellulophaga]MBU2997520.1 hypothetical protein [Cellulophaga baltica]MDO6768915.1 DUF6503 family protein [Cellulophaga sp. 1_MG-2023]
MIKYFSFFIFILGLQTSKAQVLTASELLDKSIAFHDPNNLWPTFKGKLIISMEYPDGRERLSEIKIDLPNQYFEIVTISDSIKIKQTIAKDDCNIKLNGSKNISEEEKKTHRLSCERAELMKNYYLYLYGLPMKLKDEGVQLNSEIQTKVFKGKKYLVLKVTYEENVGNDIWYFYFDPNTYAMEVYQFFHDETINDGEYILLNGIETFGSFKIPKIRAWYYNKDDKHLGTDSLIKIESFK